MLTKMDTRVGQDDPARGNWFMHSQEIKMWVDVISLAIEVTLEADRGIIEDAC